MTVCIVGGISGTGKTSIVNEFQRRQEDCEVILGSQVMFDALKLQKDDYRALRAIPDEVKDTVFAERVAAILDRSESCFRTILIDAHYINFKAGRARTGVGPWIKRMDLMVLVEADPVVIRDRIALDKERRRDWLTDAVAGSDQTQQVIALAEAMEATRIEAHRLSLVYERPLWKIDNSSDLSSAVERLAVLLGS